MFQEIDREFPENARFPLPGHSFLLYFRYMDMNEVRYARSALVSVCPARDVASGVRSGSAEYVLVPVRGDAVVDIETRTEPELEDGVAPSFTVELREAVRRYVLKCARQTYMMRRGTSMFNETGDYYSPNHTYRLVVWVEQPESGGTKFYFLPLREIPQDATGIDREMPEGAVAV